jgi:hypothetical protein
MSVSLAAAKQQKGNVGRQVWERGFNVEHILSDGSLRITMAPGKVKAQVLEWPTRQIDTSELSRGIPARILLRQTADARIKSPCRKRPTFQLSRRSQQLQLSLLKIKVGIHAFLTAVSRLNCGVLNLPKIARL